jgi:hypothetical protein
MKTGTNMETEKHNVKTPDKHHEPAKPTLDKPTAHLMNKRITITTRTNQDNPSNDELYNFCSLEDTSSSPGETNYSPAPIARDSIDINVHPSDEEDKVAKLIKKIQISITKQKKDLAKLKNDSETTDHTPTPENRNENNNNSNNHINSTYSNNNNQNSIIAI